MTEKNIFGRNKNHLWPKKKKSFLAKRNHFWPQKEIIFGHEKKIIFGHEKKSFLAEYLIDRMGHNRKTHFLYAIPLSGLVTPNMKLISVSPTTTHPRIPCKPAEDDHPPSIIKIPINPPIVRKNDVAIPNR